jgi:adenine-specific DNA methylase
MTGTPSPDRRFIEESFPVKEVGEASSREKNIRHGHISTLHIWWARRPLAASRATAYAALTPYPETEEERENKKRFIIDLCQWENSNNQALLERARREILEANGGVPPKVLDPFAGGGSYPLEALRLGCEAYASDYNPVAVLIEKATLEYPQKFGRPFENMPEWALPKGGRRKDKGGKKGQQLSLLDEAQDETDTKDFNPLLNAVRYWGEWVLEEARKELAEFYPPDPDGSIPVGYIWARTIPCQNPACGQEIPLMRSFWLSKKDKKRVALYPNTSSGKVKFGIVGDGHLDFPKDFAPDKGTISDGVATCLICGAPVDDSDIRRIFQAQFAHDSLIAVVLSNPNHQGKTFRLAEDKDLQIFKRAENALSTKLDDLTLKGGIAAIPDEEISKDRPSPNARGTSGVTRYGFNTWGSLFNSRQKLALIVFSALIRSLAYKSSLGEDMPKNNHEQAAEFTRAITLYLAFAFDKLATYACSFARWRSDAISFERAYDRQALPMIWDYGEASPLSESRGSWDIEGICKTINTLSESSNLPGKIENFSASRLSFPDNYFDAILTDPPYYDNVPYSHLSDFFYVWLKRIVGHNYPEFFSTPLTPKVGEIVAYTLRNGGFEAGKIFFENNLRDAFREMNRILKPNGVAVIVYAHKSTSGWETVINALLDSSLIITSAWPISTEMQTRLVASESAALASSIYIVARKSPRQPTGFYNDVRTELRQHLDAKLHRLWAEGIGGADFFIAAIGSAIEVFGKYEQVMDYEGNIVRAGRLLEEVRTIATDYAVRQILHDGFAAEISGLTRLYVLWRWNYGEALVPFDEARKLGQSCGIDISQAWSKTGFIRKEKEFVRLLGPQGRKLDDLDDPRDLIDVLHKSLLLWEKSQRAEMVKALADRGFGRSEAFYRVAQAISETLPLESKEKKLLDGFLAGRERVQEEVEKQGMQENLF